MKNSQKGFIVPLLLILIAVLVVGGGAYVYLQKEPASQPASDQAKGTDNSWLASTYPGKPTQTTETQQPQTQVVVPSKADTLKKLLTDNPTETKAILASWTAAEKLSIDMSIKQLLSSFRSYAEIYYDSNGNSYTSACANTNVVRGFVNPRNELVKLSGSVVCKDSPTAWAISVQLTNSTPQYECVDNLGSFIVRTSPITTTKCN